jgi:hypothetical protein
MWVCMNRGKSAQGIEWEWVGLRFSAYHDLEYEAYFFRAVPSYEQRGTSREGKSSWLRTRRQKRIVLVAPSSQHTGVLGGMVNILPTYLELTFVY